MPPARTIKPRVRQYHRHPVVVVEQHTDQVLYEDGTMTTVRELIDVMPTMEPTVFVARNGIGLLKLLSTFYILRYNEEWQWRISKHEREVFKADGTLLATHQSEVVQSIGWKPSGNARGSRGNYHKILDPAVMYDRRFDEVFPGDAPLIGRLMMWGTALRDFCDANDMDVRPTNGGISAQFLRDKRFYPNPRRKVPAATNERVREYLPGNYYHLTVVPSLDRSYTIQEYDQRRAHHYHAEHTVLPNANNLYAHGRFIDLAKCVFNRVPDNFYGLCCVDLIREPRASHNIRAFRWRIPVMEKAFVFTNEIPHLEDMGYRISGVRALWGSREKDTGLGKYAQWAQQQLDDYNDAKWIKPILLGTYGVLATKPKHNESVFRLATGGTPISISVGNMGKRSSLVGLQTKSRHKLEPGIANVLHRAMIEAATRSESVGFAQQLNADGYRVIHIYADAVMVQLDEDQAPPLLPEPWRLKRTRTHYTPINKQAFTSDQGSKLPGVSREIKQYALSGPAPNVITHTAEGNPLTEAVTGREISMTIGEYSRWQRKNKERKSARSTGTLGSRSRRETS